jgi:hypothetical protein
VGRIKELNKMAFDQMKTHKRFKTAKNHCLEGKQIIKVGNLYLTGADDLTEIAILNDKGQYRGNVIVKHLQRLGNANWAVAGDSSGNPFLKELN